MSKCADSAAIRGKADEKYYIYHHYACIYRPSSSV